ncbi:transglutaminase family protein [Propionibacteriaceae bacterium G1746]|uniref:transglutaminase family protein n=1 Tax=Aestuariimicrobium sp. G57 TaxID=3418485 RepID=UPI003C2810C3
MLLRITHRTGYQYEGGAMSSFNEARMAPRSTRDQQVLHTKLDVSPTAWSLNWTDYWGTSVTTFEVHELHHELSVTTSSTVDVRRTPVEGMAITWTDMRDADVVDRFAEYLELAPSVRPPADLSARVDDLIVATSTPGEVARSIVELITAEVRYMPGSTEVNTLAADSWNARAGVCQDMAHLVIGCLRHAGIPAAYVSGYLMPHQDPEVGTAYMGESHAWVRYWDGEWVDVDPANGSQPGDRHIEVARGREYADVAPLRGLFTGSTDSTMFVEVELTRLV